MWGTNTIRQHPDITRILVQFEEIGYFVPRRNHNLISGTVKTCFIDRVIMLLGLGNGRECGETKKACEKDGNDMSFHTACCCLNPHTNMIPLVSPHEYRRL